MEGSLSEEFWPLDDDTIRIERAFHAFLSSVYFISPALGFLPVTPKRVAGQVKNPIVFFHLFRFLVRIPSPQPSTSIINSTPWAFFWNVTLFFPSFFGSGTQITFQSIVWRSFLEFIFSLQHSGPTVGHLVPQHENDGGTLGLYSSSLNPSHRGRPGFGFSFLCSRLSSTCS